LFKRGYRTESEAAPLNEVLAAGMIQISGWDKQALLIDPMCGSGTIPIEAALYALNIPSNILRTQYGFMNFKDFDESLWNTIYNEAFNHYQSNLESVCPIMASDISERAYFSTRRNIKNLKLEKAIQLQVKPFEKLDVPEGKKMILTNPPYGERLNTANVLDLYSAIGSRLKHYYVDNEAWILSNNIDAINAIGLKATKKLVLFNGALECRFLNYHMYASSKKIFAPENNI